MATPISDIPRSVNASESETDVPTAITPTITPTIENNHRIMRIHSHTSRLGCRPPAQTSKFYANFAPLQIHWNIYGICPLSRGGRHKNVRERQHCTNTKFMHVSCGNRKGGVCGPALHIEFSVCSGGILERFGEDSESFGIRLQGVRKTSGRSSEVSGIAGPAACC